MQNENQTNVSMKTKQCYFVSVVLSNVLSVLLDLKCYLELSQNDYYAHADSI